jgi:hypothetical protein
MLFSRIFSKLLWYYRMPEQVNLLRDSLGRLESSLNQLKQNATSSRLSPREYEFKVYSQWGEDGIIDYLLSVVPVESRSFVEFGVETYIEANTLFLLKHRNWHGLVIDGSMANVEAIWRSSVYWKYDLRAVCAFITKDNINQLISNAGLVDDIGVLSVDIDGNDYWVWQAIECISPRIVIAEYNSVFGPTARVSVPYDPGFVRAEKHESKLYYGASISALDFLAQAKGYRLVAGNSAGNNVFFVREDCLAGLRPCSPEEAYVQAAFRESRDDRGLVTLTSFRERQQAIASLPLIDVATNGVTTLADQLA